MMTMMMMMTIMIIPTTAIAMIVTARGNSALIEELMSVVGLVSVVGVSVRLVSVVGLVSVIVLERLELLGSVSILSSENFKKPT